MSIWTNELWNSWAFCLMNVRTTGPWPCCWFPANNFETLANFCFFEIEFWWAFGNIAADLLFYLQPTPCNNLNGHRTLWNILILTSLNLVNQIQNPSSFSFRFSEVVFWWTPGNNALLPLTHCESHPQLRNIPSTFPTLFVLQFRTNSLVQSKSRLSQLVTT